MSFVQYSKDLPVSDHYQVIVAGGGPAGICAAVAAARQGSRTALVERYGVLGGNLTVGHVCPWCCQPRNDARRADGIVGCKRK